MRPPRKRITSTEQVVLAIIEKNPGLRPLELADKFPAGIARTSASAITARLTELRKVNRLKVPQSSTFRYFPKSATLPKGEAQWHNKIVQHTFKKKANGNGAAVDAGVPAELMHPPGLIDQLKAGGFEIAEQPGSAPTPPAAPVPAALPQTPPPIPGDVLIVLPFGPTGSEVVTVAVARRVYEVLDNLFGGRK